MPSLHTATVRSYLQGLASAHRLLDLAEAHCREQSLPDTALTEARLADDMWSFAKQIFECEHHSARAIIGVREGVFRPDRDAAPSDFASLRAKVGQAIATLEAVTPDELEAAAGNQMRFEFGTHRTDYLVEDFLLSFSLPNFYFHLATAYAILRARGLPLGKRDYLGTPRSLVRD